MRTFLPPTVDGWGTSEEPRLYSGREIFNYMDGAGEVYLAYHYRDLLVQRYTRANQDDILVEIFDMGMSQNAFGISTYMRGRGPAVRIGRDGEYKSGLLCFWKARYYVCVRTENVNGDAERALLKTGRLLAKSIRSDGPRPALLRRLPEGAYRPESLRYFFRDEILRTHLTLPQDNLLLLTDSTEGLLVRMRHDRSKVLMIRYPDSTDARAALRNFAEGYLPGAGEEALAETQTGTWAAWRQVDRAVIAVIDAPTRSRAQKILASIVRRMQ